jgi:hypothetical protein
MASKKKKKKLPGEDTAKKSDTFKTGDTVVASGIYTVQPDDKSEPPLEVTCVRGKEFPPCNKCKGKAIFTLKQPARHWKHHDNFRS